MLKMLEILSRKLELTDAYSLIIIMFCSVLLAVVSDWSLVSPDDTSLKIDSLSSS